jgi:hypothetical protein
MVPAKGGVILKHRSESVLHQGPHEKRGRRVPLVSEWFAMSLVAIYWLLKPFRVKKALKAS